jgi:hypothetical protein
VNVRGRVEDPLLDMRASVPVGCDRSVGQVESMGLWLLHRVWCCTGPTACHKPSRADDVD